MSNLEIRKLTAFGLTVQETLDRSLLPSVSGLSLSAAIDIATERFRQLDFSASSYVESVRSTAPSSSDDLAQIEALFVQLRKKVGDFYVHAKTMRDVSESESLLSDEVDTLVAYDELLNTVASLHNSLNSLSWLTGEHLADNDEKAPGTFDTAEGLFNAMGV